MEIKDLQEISSRVRKDIIKMIYEAKTGHPAGSLSSVEIFVALYFDAMNVDPNKPDMAERDRLFVSAGHICPAQYAVMAERGFFKKNALSAYAKLGSPLQGHPERLKLPGIENTSGPLGLGLAQAVGYAIAANIDQTKNISSNPKFRVYCISSDAEHDEGNHWEAVLLAAKYKLSNLTLIIDRNMIQIELGTEQTLPLGDLSDKYRSFGWNSLTVNGHDFFELRKAFENARRYEEGPTVIIAKTTAGKGVNFMEGNPDWHAKVPNDEEYEKAINELNEKR